MNTTDSLIANGHDNDLQYVSHVDEIPLTVYFIFLALISTSLNGLSIYLTQKYDQLRVPHMYTRMAYAVFDIVFAISMAIHYSIAFQFPNAPKLAKCLTGDFCIALFFGTTQLTAFIALERYFYFCKPMVYDQYFSFRSIAISSLLIFLITQGYVIIKEFLYGRELQPLIGMCVFTFPVFHNISNLLIFVLPAVVVTLFSICKIINLLRNISVHPSVIPNATYSEPMLRRRPARKGLRLIFLVSGAFWGTYIPAFVIRTVIFQVGYTWVSLNAYENPTISTIFRYTHYSIALSTVVDPLIYFGVCKDLRTAFRRLYSNSGTFTWHDN